MNHEKKEDIKVVYCYLQTNFTREIGLSGEKQQLKHQLSNCKRGP